MIKIENQIVNLVAQKKKALIHVRTMGNFQVWRNGVKVSSKEWGRDKTVQLFQFLITARHRNSLHKEQIVDRLWEDNDGKSADQNFKVAMHGINKVLEPNRPSRTEPKFILRQGITYQLKLEEIWIDTEAVEKFIAIGNQAIDGAPEIAIKAYQEAIKLYEGIYLPNRLYEDWSSEERERLQILSLGAMITISELLVEKNPMESIRFAQKALLIDHAWEDAYRVQMLAYLQKGNRPMAIKTYKQCEKVLEEEFGIEPLPETQQLLRKKKGLKS
jgi:DNA-binding SARP family transcriptional activator